MKDPKLLFHYISYLQYPFLLIGLYYVCKPYWEGFDGAFQSLNTALIFMGLGISLSTLQDTRKTQNKVSKQIWEHPTKGKVALAFMSGTTLFFILFGLYHYFAVDQNVLKELSFGMIVLGIGLIGLLKAAIEMFENHRLDKKDTTE